MFQSLTTSVTNERPTLAHILPGEVQKIVKSSKLNPAALVTYEAGPEDQEIAEFLQEFSIFRSSSIEKGATLSASSTLRAV